MLEQRRGWWCVVILAAVAVGCGPGEGPEAALAVEGVAEVSSTPGQQQASLTLWDNHAGTTAAWPRASGSALLLNVCFVPENLAIYDSWKPRIRDAIERSWAHHGNVTFLGWGTCAAGDRATHIRILMTDTTSDACIGQFNNCRAGNPSYTMRIATRPSTEVYPDCASRMETCVRAGAIHEFGHALGFNHESGHPQATCAKEDSSTSTGVTPYDINSIMSSCGPWRDGRLSPLDIVGVQYVYGRRPPGTMRGVRGYCLDALGGATEGGPVGVWPCNWGNNQSWGLLGNGGFNGLWLNRGYALRAADGQGNFTSLVRLTANTSLPGTRYWLKHISLRGYGGKVLDIHAGNPNNGAAVVMWTQNNGINQRFIWHSDGTIRSLMNGKCLDIVGVNPNNGARLQMYDCLGGANQRWTINSGGAITSNLNGKCIDVGGGNTQDGAPVVMWDCNRQHNQAWSLVGELRSEADHCVDDPSYGQSPGHQVHHYTCHGGENQQWEYYP